jgi:hypothetical protein
LPPIIPPRSDDDSMILNPGGVETRRQHRRDCG